MRIWYLTSRPPGLAFDQKLWAVTWQGRVVRMGKRSEDLVASVLAGYNHLDEIIERVYGRTRVRPENVRWLTFHLSKKVFPQQGIPLKLRVVEERIYFEFCEEQEDGEADNATQYQEALPS